MNDKAERCWSDQQVRQVKALDLMLRSMRVHECIWSGKWPDQICTPERSWCCCVENASPCGRSGLCLEALPLTSRRTWVRGFTSLSISVLICKTGLMVFIPSGLFGGCNVIRHIKQECHAYKDHPGSRDCLIWILAVVTCCLTLDKLPTSLWLSFPIYRMETQSFWLYMIMMKIDISNMLRTGTREVLFFPSK